MSATKTEAASAASAIEVNDMPPVFEHTDTLYAFLSEYVGGNLNSHAWMSWKNIKNSFKEDITIVFCILLIIILPCHSQLLATVGKAKAPYEATWMKLTKVGDSYVVYNYPSLWPDAVAGTKSPEIVKIQGNQMTWITYSDDIFTCSLKKVEKRDNGVYFMQTDGCSYYYEFQWEDEKKHIARWKDYLGYITNKPIGVLYIDSLYNTFPIVDYDWGPPEDDNGYWD